MWYLFTGEKADRPNARYHLKATGDAAKSWDFNQYRPPGKRTTVFESTGHLVKSCLGGGIVSIHEAYKDCGLITSLVLNMVLGTFVGYLMYVLATSAQKAYGRTQVPQMSYPDLAEAALEISPWPKLRKFSKCFRYLVDVTIMIDLFGSCCCYQVIIARSIKQLVDGTEEVSDGGNIPIRAYVAALLIPCILICMILSLKYLAPFSIVADIFIFLVVITTVVYGIKSASMSISDFPAFRDLKGLLSYIGVCVFSMEGVGATLAIENNMKEPKKISLVLVIGMSIVMCMVMAAGFFGYYGFGEKSKAPVTLNFPWNWFTIFLRVAIALMVYVTFALNFWIPFDLAWYYIKKKYNPDKYWLSERLYRALFIIIITGITVAFPNVTKFMGVLGAFCLSNMGFIYPAFIQLSLDWEDPGLGRCCWRFWKFIFILLFGLVLMIIGTVFNFYSMLEALGFVG